MVTTLGWKINKSYFSILHPKLCLRISISHWKTEARILAASSEGSPGLCPQGTTPAPTQNTEEGAVLSQINPGDQVLLKTWKGGSPPSTNGCQDGRTPIK